MPDELRTLTARWIIPMAGPPLERGTITLTGGRIVAVEPHGVRAAHEDFGDAAIMPGLVNAHTHLDLTGMKGLAEPRPDFVGWLREVIAYRRTLSSDDIQNDIAEGIAECLRCGTTLVGDISGDGTSWELLAESPLGAVVFRELLGLPKPRAEQAWIAAQQWLGAATPTARCRPGLSPHAPYSVRVSLMRAASQAGVPVAVHLAESPFERELLTDHTGPFVPFLQDLGVWDPVGLSKGPEHVIRLTTGGDNPVLFIHGNYLAASASIPSNASIVYCPRTHAAFEHPPHPFREFLSRGVRVCLGTDSLASNPDLSLLEEARFVYRMHPDLPPSTILAMATLAGAQALGRADDTGSLVPGKHADFVVVPLTAPASGDPVADVLESSTGPTQVFIAGTPVFP